jgi:hypothetical protein
MSLLRRLTPAAAWILTACAEGDDAVLAPDAGAPSLDVARAADVPAAQDVLTLRDVASAPDVTDAPAPTDATDGARRCMADRDCGGETPACDPGTGGCVACVRDEHCGAGRLCVGNLCVAGCTPAQPCPAGQSCCTGACVDPASSAVHCGACGTVCRAANATPACLNAVCGVGQCAAGFGDCNRRGDDGCEVDLQRDTASCGACGAMCPTPANASAATCAAGRCGFTCTAGFADCDTDASNGCEVDLRVSAAHCGLCGNACPMRPNTNAPGCRAGRCDTACAAGFGDCDGNPDNGCEVNLARDPNHCSACGMRRAEVCDGADSDCDGTVDNACPQQLDPQTLPGNASTAWGGGGGSPFNQPCPAGQFVTGIFGRSGSRIDGFGVVCSVPALLTDRAASPYRYSVGFQGATTVGPVGSGGGDPFRFDCPSNSVVMRVQGRSGSRVDQVRVECYRWDVVQRGTAWVTVRGAITGASNFQGGGGGSPFDHLCPESMALHRISGRAGTELDQATAWCAPVALSVIR